MVPLVLVYAGFKLIQYAYNTIKKENKKYNGKAFVLKEPHNSTIPSLNKRNRLKDPGMVITILTPSLPLHEWDFRLLPEPRYFPWHQVIGSPVIEKKYFKSPYFFIINEAFHLSELEIPDGPMARRIARHHHTCLTADLICVYYTTPYIKNDINARRQGILTICPNCRRQVGFNGTMMN